MYQEKKSCISSFSIGNNFQSYSLINCIDTQKQLLKNIKLFSLSFCYLILWNDASLFKSLFYAKKCANIVNNSCYISNTAQV